ALRLGVWGARRPELGRVLLGAGGVIQTLPSLALLVFMIPLLKTGTLPAIVALFLYGLLPIMANTAAGLKSIPPSLAESAEALGLSPLTRLWRRSITPTSQTTRAGSPTSTVTSLSSAPLWTPYSASWVRATTP